MTDNNEESLTRFNGERQNWKTFKKQVKGHKIINEEKYEDYEGIADPRNRDRVTQLRKRE